MHRNCELIFRKYAMQHFRPNMRVLEIGPNGFPTRFQTLVNDPSIKWETIDVADAPNSAGLTYKSTDGYTFPIADDRFDVVISANVIEHVRTVWRWMREVARVCKPGGMVITLNPVNWPYHEAPVDCWRIYPEGMRALYEEAGLSVELATFANLDSRDAHPPITKIGEVKQEARNLARRLLGKHAWPLGAWQNWCAIDGVTVGTKLAPPVA